MKTAMQEWFDELKANYPYMANEIYQKGFEKYLEKEKEQIIDAYRIASINNSPNEDMKNIKPEYWQVNAEMWYDKHYNQNKLTIKTDGKVGLSNPVETTNNKLNLTNNL